jgi:RNA polymerase sigma-70 factor (ECF subfamily)
MEPFTGASENPELPDEQFVDRVLAGEVAAFDTLVLRYKERLYGVIYNMTSNHEDTNDLLMEVFDKAYRSLGSYKKDASFYSWIYRIAVNRAINLLRQRKKTSKGFSLNEIDLDLSNEPNFLDSGSGSDPEKAAQLQELQKKLNESLQKLSEEHRATVVLFDIEGMSHAEIARVMNTSEGTVRSRLHYAHKQLQKMLGSYLR